MDRKLDQRQLDRMFDGIELTDEQLDHVIGGVNLSAKQAVASAPQLTLNTLQIGHRPGARK